MDKNNKLDLDTVAERLIEWREMWKKERLFKAAELAEIIWPDREWISPQGAAASANWVLPKVGAVLKNRQDKKARGWDLQGVRKRQG